jgi:electron transfer flavoprotein beta subunit
VRIVVTVKYVPDINAERGFSDLRVVRDPAEGSLNEIDENAIEAALRLIEGLPEEQRESSEVIAISMAPADGDLALRKAFQMGVDRGVRITDDALAGSDYFGTTTALAAAVRRLEGEAPVDLVVMGMAALDGLGTVLPVLLAAELDRPQLTLAKKVEHDAAAGTLTITRETAEATEVLTAPLPAVLSVTDSANTARFPNFKLIMAARTKPVEVWTAADLGLDPASVGSAGARAVTSSAQPSPPRPEVEIVQDRGEGGKALADFLIRNGLV